MGCPSSVYLGDNLTFSICTHDPDTGVLTDAGTAPTYRVYEDDTGTVMAGMTGDLAKLDDANTTGFYVAKIACTAANGFEDAKTYTVYIEATVNADTGGICYGFRCEHPARLLLLDFTGLTVTATRCMLNALRFLRNKWALSGTTLSVKCEDDSTEAWNATVTTDSSADPITASDPS